MFSNKKASNVMLLIPAFLLIVIAVLSVLLINSNKANSTDTSKSENDLNPVKSENSNSNSTSTTSNTADTTNNGNDNSTPDNKKDFSAAMNAVPSRELYPSNKCPEAIVMEDNESRLFAIEGSSKFMLSATDKDWISANCPATEVLTF